MVVDENDWNRNPTCPTHSLNSSFSRMYMYSWCPKLVRFILFDYHIFPETACHVLLHQFVIGLCFVVEVAKRKGYSVLL